MASLGTKTARGALWIVAWRLLSRLFGVVSVVVLARLLTPDDFGLLAIAVTIVGALETFSHLGWQDAVVRSRNFDSAVLNSAFSISVAQGTAVAVALALTAPMTAEFVGDQRVESILYIFAAFSFIKGFENVGIVEFRRDLRFDKEFKYFFLPKLLSFLCALAFALWFRNYWALIIGYGVNRLAALVTSYCICIYRPRFSIEHLRWLLGFSFWVWAISIFIFVRERLPSLIIARGLGSIEVGRFTMGLEIAMLPVNDLFQPIERALFSGYSAASRSDAGMDLVFTRSIGVLLVLLLPIAIGLSSVAAPLVALALGDSWRATIPVIEWLSIASIFFVLASVSMTCLVAMARLRDALAVTVFSAAAISGLCIAVLDSHGVVGIVRSITAVLAIESAVMIALTNSRLRGRVSELVSQMWRQSLAAAAMTLALWLSGLGWHTASGSQAANALQLISAVGMGAAVYCLTLLLLWQSGGRPDGAERWLLIFAGDILNGRRQRKETGHSIATPPD